MSNMDILEKLRKAPDAIKILEVFQHELEAEKAKREEYYNLVHENIKAEFINGEIFFHSPAKNRHWIVSSNLMGLLQPYVKRNGLGTIGSEKVMIRLTRNDYEPDIVFFRAEKSAHFTPDQMLFPPPDLAIEILSPSTEKNDREIKFEDYAAHGVEEYWIIDPDKQTFEQYILTPTGFQLQVKLQSEGTIHAVTVKDFKVDIAEVFT